MAINTVAKEQMKLGEMMNNLLKGIIREGTSRRTADYVTSKRAKAIEYWEEFTRKHEQMTLLDPTEQHIYFDNDLFNQVKERYQAIMNQLKEYETDKNSFSNEINDQKEKSLEHGKNETKNDENKNTNWTFKAADFGKGAIGLPMPKQYETFEEVPRNNNKNVMTINLRKYEFKTNSLNRAIYEVEATLAQQTRMYAEFKRTQINVLWCEISQIYEDICIDMDISAYQLNEINEEYMKLEERYQATTLKLIEKQQQTDGNRQQEYQRSMVPRPNLPMFDGEFGDWTTFHDMYTKMVHDNTALSSVEKMQLLKTHLRGEAIKPIQHMNITEVNYEAAWKIICNRYYNKRAIFNVQMDNLLNQRTLQGENANAVKQLYDTTRECLYAITNLGIDVEGWGPMVVHILEVKLDRESRRLYEQTLKEPRKITKLEDMLAFMEQRFQSLEVTKENNKRIERNFFVKKNAVRQFHITVNECKYCKEDHIIYQCKKFQQLQVNDKRSFVLRNKLCLNCMNHPQDTKCNSKSTCMVCKKSHHTSLHVYRQQSNKNNGNNVTIANHVNNQKSSVLLATATVRVRTAFGGFETFRALIDQGSQASFIAENAFQILSLPKIKVSAEVTGLGSTKTVTARAKTMIEIIPNFPNTTAINCETFVISKLTKNLPDKKIESIELHEDVKRKLADPTFDQPGPIDLILGAEFCSRILLDGVKKMDCGLVAQHTKLGWILSGALNPNRKNISIINMNSLVEINEAMGKLWELEDDETNKILSEEDEKCEKLFNENYQRKSDGSFMVRIPFKNAEPTLGESRNVAMARYLQLEKRFKKDPELARQYKQFIEEYLQLKHMKAVSPRDLKNKNSYYMPHQPVFKNDSTTTKLRVVFDASAKTSNGKSLNDTMLIGPRLQPELAHILLRWRIHKIVFTADIEKMYRCIEIHPCDQKYHRILWRFSNDQPIKEYQLTTVTYGTSSAPYLAVKAVQQLAKEEANNYKIGSEVLLSDFYVDDLMSGAEDLETAKRIQKELIEMLKKGKFNLRKWTSNSEAFISQIPKDLREKKSIEIEPSDKVKTLGMHWYPLSDAFKFKLNVNKDAKNTKRTILSDLAHIFDPIGLIAPITIIAKIILQEIWNSGCEWDKEPEGKILENWKKFKSSLIEIESIKVPRWIKYSTKYTIQLHGFCDASEKAYAAAIYTRIQTDNEVFTTLLTAKARVAPIKMKKTLPRLELCGAALLAKMLQQTEKILHMEKMEIYAWTDSMITLAWIKAGAAKWKTFVSNKVAEINLAIPEAKWQYVRSQDNPADIASRGMNPTTLSHSEMWWNGPKWLKGNQKEWVTSTKIEETLEEKKHEKISVFKIIVTKKECEITNILERSSTLMKAVRITAWSIRFINNIQKKHKKEEVEKSKFITSSELKSALNKIILCIQKQNFATELKELEKGVNINNKSKIRTLDPFCDEMGILRVGGRLSKSQLPYDEKHPIIVPTEDKLTKLIILDAHQRVLHSGYQGTYGYIRRKYWIINSRNEVKKILNKCIICFRYKCKTNQQKMGNLPSARVTPSHTFQHTGIDYAGPLKIRVSKGRGNKSSKGYIVVFVCLATKAIHIEIVSDMTKEAFMAAFNRFNSRRGPCYNIYTDNGTNFVGARRIFDEDLKQAIKENLQCEEELNNIGITWHFIPPGAPHFGGIWEAGVKSIKYHLHRIIGESTLTYEELSTVICQIEGVLNSRPLCEMSSDPTDYAVITPAHFLTGRALSYPPKAELSYDNLKPSTRWKLVQKISLDFWKIWSKEYLNRLQQRTKWTEEHPNIKIGDMILLKEENIVPARWPLARVIETYPGEDGKVRVVKIKTQHSTFTRPVSKVCKLPFESTEYQHSQSDENEIKANCSTVSQISEIKETRKGRVIKQPALWFSTLMLIAVAFNPVNANVTVKEINPGIYIEEIGEVHVKRGMLRIQVNISAESINQDQLNINNTLNEMDKLCNKAKQLSSDVHCYSWVDHLENQVADITSTIEAIRHGHRSKRGILGNILQAIFGVNDEIYRNIDLLDQNQQFLTKSSKQQAKIMISTLTVANETDQKVTSKLNAFTEKLNKGLEAIDKMKGWFTISDINKIDIHLLTAYHTSENYLNEIQSKYHKLLRVITQQGSLMDFLSFRTIKDIVNQTQKKLSPEVVIIKIPTNKLELNRDGTNFILSGYLNIIETTKYTTFKAIAVPLREADNKFITLELTEAIISVNNDLQLYFEQSESTFRKCEKMENHEFICAPEVIHNMETNPSCTIDELFGKHDKQLCNVYHLETTHIIWRQLHRSNTWMFTTGTSKAVTKICNNTRDQIILNGTGSIEIDKGCVLKTRTNLIESNLSEDISVKATFVKPVDFSEYLGIINDGRITPLIQFEKETTINTSESFYNKVMTNETIIQNQLDDHHWRKILSHPATLGIGTVSFMVIIAALVITIVWRRNKCRQTAATFILPPMPQSALQAARGENV